MEGKLLLFLMGLFVVNLAAETRASGGYSGEERRADRSRDELPDYLFDVKFDEYPVSNVHFSCSLWNGCERKLFFLKSHPGVQTGIAFDTSVPRTFSCSERLSWTFWAKEKIFHTKHKHLNVTSY